MSFQTTNRIFALAPELLATLFPALQTEYAELLPDGNRQVLTLGAHWDDSEHTRLRAASLADGTITPIALTDGRVAFQCMWQADLMAEFDANGISGVEELTQEQLQELTPIPEPL